MQSLLGFRLFLLCIGVIPKLQWDTPSRCACKPWLGLWPRFTKVWILIPDIKVYWVKHFSMSYRTIQIYENTDKILKNDTLSNSLRTLRGCIKNNRKITINFCTPFYRHKIYKKATFHKKYRKHGIKLACKTSGISKQWWCLIILNYNAI